MHWIKINIKSISFQLSITLLALISVMLLFTSGIVLSSMHISTQLQRIDDCVVQAKQLSNLVDEHSSTSYFFASGNVDYTAAMAADSIQTLHDRLLRLAEDTNDDAPQLQLRYVSRAFDRLQKYTVEMLQHDERDQRIASYRQIYNACESMTALLNDYIYAEIECYEVVNYNLYMRNRQMLGQQFMLILFMLMTAAYLFRHIFIKFIRPIHTLVIRTQQLGDGNFSLAAPDESVSELVVLQDSFNSMTIRLQQLMERVHQTTRAQERLELRLMQEQIKPHFLYNTLEMIIWMAESADYQKIIAIVQSMSRFFHTVLSGGQELITVQQEIACIQNYLFLQKVRYQDILEYYIEVDPNADPYLLPKLSLQPLVENALYHGLKNRRGGGRLDVSVRLEEAQLVLSVSDTGAGIPTERLESLRSAIAGGADTVDDLSDKKGGFGLCNVHRRIRLRYGSRYGLSLTSTYGEGTTARLTLPCQLTDSSPDK